MMIKKWIYSIRSLFVLDTFDIVFTHDMLKSKINKLKENKSPGDDGIT